MATRRRAPPSASAAAAIAAAARVGALSGPELDPPQPPGPEATRSRRRRPGTRSRPSVLPSKWRGAIDRPSKPHGRPPHTLRARAHLEHARSRRIHPHEVGADRPITHPRDQVITRRPVTVGARPDVEVPASPTSRARSRERRRRLDPHEVTEGRSAFDAHQREGQEEELLQPRKSRFRRAASPHLARSWIPGVNRRRPRARCASSAGSWPQSAHGATSRTSSAAKQSGPWVSCTVSLARGASRGRIRRDALSRRRGSPGRRHPGSAGRSMSRKRSST